MEKKTEKNGFTLVELLGVICILAVILAIAVPIIQNTIAASKAKVYAVTVNQLFKSTKEYIIEYGDEIDGLEDNGEGFVTIGDLITKGILEDSVKNPITGDDFSNDATIRITQNSNGTYSYNFYPQGYLVPILVWNKNYGGTASDVYRDIVEDNDNYVTVGASNSINVDLTGLSKGSTDAVIVKYNASGSILWKKNYGGTDVESYYSIGKTSDGYVAVGKSASTDVDLSSLNKGNSDAIIVKYDKNGNVLWKKNFGGTDLDIFYGVAIATDGYIAVGTSSSTDTDLTGLNKGGQDSIIVKYDTSGNILWKKDFGGANDDVFYGVDIDTDSYAVVGTSFSTNVDLTGLNDGYEDGIIVKYDTSGNIIWKKNFGGNDYDGFNDVVVVSDGYITVGDSESNTNDVSGLNKGGDDAVIVKYDKSGNVVWNNNYGGSYDDRFVGLVATTMGLFPVGWSQTSSSMSFSTVVSYSLDGEFIWEKSYLSSNGGDMFCAIDDVSNGYVIAGYALSTTDVFTGLNKGGLDGTIFKIQNP